MHGYVLHYLPQTPPGPLARLHRLLQLLCSIIIVIIIIIIIIIITPTPTTNLGQGRA
jgi:hypothetical protein